MRTCVEQPSYYAIIPADVRYDKALPDKAKLLYGEITALANKEGYCWAENAYFADLYGVSKETISRLVSKLVSRGYLSTKLFYKKGSKQVEERRIYISSVKVVYINASDDVSDNTSADVRRNTAVDVSINTPIDKNVNTPIDENVKDSSFINNTRINNTRMNKDIPSSAMRKCELLQEQLLTVNESPNGLTPQVLTTTPLNNYIENQEQQSEIEIVKGTETSIDHSITLINQPLTNQPLINPLFEQFWLAYPKKDQGKSTKCKKDAEKVWQRLNPDETLFLSIMESLTAKISWWKANQIDMDRLPHASTWLKREFSDKLAQSKTIIEQYFDQFWLAYPRKVGKIEAEGAWLSIAPDEVLFQTIMQGLEDTKQWWTINNTTSKYIPHAKTWLNGKAWNDELDFSSPSTPVSAPNTHISTTMNYEIGGANDPYLNTMQSTKPTGGTTNATVNTDSGEESISDIYQRLLRERAQQEASAHKG